MITSTIRSLIVAAAASVTLLFTACSDPVTPEPVDYTLEVNDTTGVTFVDTNEISDDWQENPAPYDWGLVPQIVRPYEAEQLASEAMAQFFDGAIKESAFLAQISAAERSQLKAFYHMLDFHGLDDEIDSVTNSGGMGVGVFHDDSTQNVWNWLAANRPNNVQEAIVTYAYIAEYQLHATLVATREHIFSTQHSQDLWAIVRGMNLNHFLAAQNAVEALGIAYTPTFLTAEDYKDIQDDPFVKF
jgi:hypothetical protein